MAKAKRLPSGNYRTRVYVEKGKYKSFTAPTKRESEYLASQYALNKNKYDDIDGVTIYDIVYDFIATREPYISPSTTRTYYHLMKHFNQFKTLKLRDFSPTKHQEWIDSIHLAPKTIKNINGLLVSALKHHGINLKPVELPKKEYSPMQIPTTDDIRLMVNYFKDKGDLDMVIAVYLAAIGTLRRGEVCALLPGDIDRKNNTVSITKAQVLDKNRKLVIKPPKTYSSNRVVEIPSDIIKLIPEDKVTDLNIERLSKKFRHAMKMLDMSFTFHSLRHYSASIMHAQNIPTQYIMERGGWKTESTLNRIYRNSLDDYRKKFNEQTNDYFKNSLI